MPAKATGTAADQAREKFTASDAEADKRYERMQRNLHEQLDIQHREAMDRGTMRTREQASRDARRESRKLSQMSAATDVTREARRPPRGPPGPGLLRDLAAARKPEDLRSLGVRAASTGATPLAARPPVNTAGPAVFAINTPPGSRRQTPAVAEQARHPSAAQSLDYSVQMPQGDDPSYCVNCACLHGFKVCPACGTRRVLVKAGGGG